ncbi:c-type cytochrome [Silanimonas sp.]|uniref:c-type cytochrome n=1 Tax=Silanimonas sp. TaxID=1929290 RepID=UPI0025F099D5|nr:c-type cytochrome [Silanimonas sp.]
MKVFLAALIALGLSAAALAQTSPPAGSARLADWVRPAPVAPPELGSCAACHGTDGAPRMRGTPHIGGLSEAYLILALHAYRDGRRRHSAMNAISNALQPQDIGALARWYAAQPGPGAR